MSELWERIRAARIYANLSQEELGKACKPPVSKAGAGLWESKNPIKRTTPQIENIITISHVTGAPIDWLLDDKSIIPGDWMEENTDRFIRISKDKLLPRSPTFKRIPLLDVQSAFGFTYQSIKTIKAWEDMESILVDKDEIGVRAFAVRVDDESMLPDFKIGEVVIVDPDVKPQPGDFVLANLNDESITTIKIYRPRHRKDSAGQELVELAPINPNWPRLTVQSSDIVGKIVSHHRTF